MVTRVDCRGELVKGPEGLDCVRLSLRARKGSVRGEWGFGDGRAITHDSTGLPNSDQK